MSTAKQLDVALFYLQSECYKAGFPETGYLVEVARLSLSDAHGHPRAEAPAEAEAPRQRSDETPLRLRA